MSLKLTVIAEGIQRGGGEEVVFCFVCGLDCDVEVAAELARAGGAAALGDVRADGFYGARSCVFTEASSRVLARRAVACTLATRA